jgi:diaminopimelate epimerase
MIKPLDFLKMEGLGNDFIVTHRIRPNHASAHLIARESIRLCNRRRSIGADGFIMLLPSKIADFQMRIFNSDGSEAEMCGNGIRCCALYVKKLKLSRKRSLTFETNAGSRTTEITKTGLVRVTMGRPVLSAPQIPTTCLPSGTAKVSDTMLNEELHVEGGFSRSRPCPWETRMRSSMRTPLLTIWCGCGERKSRTILSFLKKPMSNL